jgi:hypothetical protein
MYRTCAMAALLLSAATLCAADSAPTADDSAPVPWYKRIFSDPKPKPTPKPAAPEPPITRQDVARSVEQEQKVYMERLAFCTKLRQIAVQTGDEELERKANELEKQAFDVFTKRTAKLPALMDSVKASESALDKKNSEPAAGSASASPTKTYNGRAPNGRPIVASE